MNNNNKPDTCQGDLRKLPPALKSLRARDQWTVWLGPAGQQPLVEATLSGTKSRTSRQQQETF